MKFIRYLNLFSEHLYLNIIALISIMFPKMIWTSKSSRSQLFCIKLFWAISQNLQQNTCARLLPGKVTISRPATWQITTPIYLNVERYRVLAIRRPLSYSFDFISHSFGKIILPAFYKIAIFKNFLKVMEKHLWWSSFSVRCHSVSNIRKDFFKGSFRLIFWNVLQKFFSNINLVKCSCFPGFYKIFKLFLK